MSKDNELLLDYARFAHKNNLAINNPDTSERFLAEMAPRLNTAITDQNLVYGLRTEHMFEAMIRSLAQFRVFKHEDNGVVHGTGKLRAPDFRIVLEDGRQWLIEVKNVNCASLDKQVTNMSVNYVASLQRYADAVGVPLMFAHYWPKMNMWTVVKADQFITPNGGLKIDFLDAFRFSYMGELGDTMISLPGPLLVKARGQRDQDPTMEKYTLSFWRDDTQLTDRRDIKHAIILMQFGTWGLDGPVDNQLTDGTHEIEYRSTVQEESDDGFDSIGFASMIFCNFYRDNTRENGAVTGLIAEHKPEWFEPLREWDFKSSNLQLRLFKIKPSLE
ncbi:MAG: hypothetical protein L3J30_12125 [Marinosulfonomonas sp.]|nr:hypothetical protein [Marinosulfonomonas sp.]